MNGTAQPPAARPAAQSHRAAWIVLAASLTFFSAATLHMKDSVETSAERAFRSRCDGLYHTIENRLDDHARILLSGEAFFNASEHVTREEWRIFNQSQKVETQLPGIQGIGFSLLIPPEDLARHIQEIRSEGFPEYAVRPAGPREAYSSIIYLEPFSRRNLRAFGYDMLSEPVRRDAMERARDTDSAALSGKVVLVQETEKEVQAGTLMYVPVYRRGLPTDSLAQRRAAIIGWVYSPYRMNDLMQGILGGASSEKDLHLKVYDGAQASPESLLYDWHPVQGAALPARFAHREALTFHGKLWTLDFTQTGGGFFTVEYSKVWLTMVGGVVISLLLFTLIRALLSTRFEAQRMAERLTVDLRMSEAKFHEMADRAEQANVAKSEFLAIMSHEIRTPMNGVIGMTELLLDTELNGKQRHCAETVRASGESLLYLLNDILDISKIEAGKLELEALDFKLADVLEKTSAMLALRAEEKGLAFLCSADPDVPAYLCGDPGRLRQVLLNLADNAVKFTRKGEVAVRAALVSAEGSAIVVRFSVRDTGIGIPADKQEALFQKFSQADSSTARRYGGTGLGLAISRQLVQLMGGEIGMTSAPDQGSEFWFTVRLAPPSEPMPAPDLAAPDGAPTLGPARILLAEDNGTNQQVAVGLLEKLGLTADVAANGLEAVHAFKSRPYALVFMDIQMPEMDGFEATKAIRKLEEENQKSEIEDPGSAAGQAAPPPSIPRIPIIAMTAHALQGDREKCLAAGMDDFVSKPLDVAVLAATINKWLPQMQSLRQPISGEGDSQMGGAAPAFDRAGLMDRLGNDEDLARMVIERFLSEQPGQILLLKSFVAAGDARQVERQAHKIRGACATAGAAALCALAAELEQAGNAENLAGISARMPELDMQMEALQTAMNQES
ncbi:MAG: CHASE domain-containing protein [Verrucomicrobiae bacterium]